MTGGSRGIGRAACVGLAEAGADVVVGYASRHEDAKAVAAEIEALGRRALALRIDVTDEASVATVVPAVDDFVGEAGLHLLLNNAGIYPGGTLETITLDEWRRVMAVNVEGPFLMARALVHLLRRSGSGRIVNVGSVLAFNGGPGWLHYGAAKAAVGGLTRGLARELGPDGITVNCVVPSMVATDTAGEVAPDAVEPVVASQSVSAYEQPSDLVGALVFLASAASRFVTGQHVMVEGGRIFL